MLATINTIYLQQISSKIGGTVRRGMDHVYPDQELGATSVHYEKL